MQELKEICGLVSSVGFPIVVCVYFMVTTNRRLIEIRDAIREQKR